MIEQNPNLKQKKDLLDSIPGIGKVTIPHVRLCENWFMLSLAS
jgi:hypothetical protein